MPRNSCLSAEVEDVVDTAYDNVIDEVECLRTAEEQEDALRALRERIREHLRSNSIVDRKDDEDEQDDDG